MEGIHRFCSNWLVYYDYKFTYRGIVGYAIGYYIEQRIQGLNTFLFEVERGIFRVMFRLLRMMNFMKWSEK